jgi:hypothetical protein
MKPAGAVLETGPNQSCSFFRLEELSLAMDFTKLFLSSKMSIQGIQ